MDEMELEIVQTDYLESKSQNRVICTPSTFCKKSEGNDLMGFPQKTFLLDEGAGVLYHPNKKNMYILVQ